MRKPKDKKQKLIQKRKRQGMQDLRFLTLVLFLGLFFYTIFNFFIVMKLTVPDVDLMREYVLSACLSLVSWCIVFRMLWRFNRLGRYVYWCVLGLQGYLYRDAWHLWNLAMEPNAMKFCFLSLFALKCLLLLYGGWKLLVSSTIRNIWNIDNLFDDELLRLEMSDKPEVLPKPTPKSQVRSRQRWKKAAIRLGVCLYVTTLAIFVVLSVLTAQLPQWKDGLRLIQYQLFSECLFSALVWGVPMITMVLGKEWSAYMILVSWSAEVLKLIVSFQDLALLMKTSEVVFLIKLLYVMMEILRFVLIAFACHSVFHPIQLFQKSNK